MKLLITLMFLVGLAAAAPSEHQPDMIATITKKFYPDSFIIYKSEHDIVSIIVPLNTLNVDEDNPPPIQALKIMFFVEADIDAEGKRTYQGLYVFKDNKATMLLENGRDGAAVFGENTAQVFFAATDGLYEYKADTNEAVRYGSVTDSIIGIAVHQPSDIIYILTEDHELYKVTDAGNTKTKVDEVVNAQQIVTDYKNNLYFYSEDLQPYVLTTDGVKKIEGLPTNSTKVNLIKPPVIIEDAVPFIVNNAAYIIHANGTSEYSHYVIKPKAMPTAFAMEAATLEYFAYNKKIYFYNMFDLIVSGKLAEEMIVFEVDSNDVLQALARKMKRTKSAV